jgi:hypothetical protein
MGQQDLGTTEGNTPASSDVLIERVQLGIRMERSMVKVLKGIAELEDLTLGELMESIVLHSFEPVPGQEGESCASPYSKAELQSIAELRKVYGMTDDVHAFRRSRSTGSSLHAS